MSRFYTFVNVHRPVSWRLTTMNQLQAFSGFKQVENSFSALQVA